jgi:hypothetical protein
MKALNIANPKIHLRHHLYYISNYYIDERMNDCLHVVDGVTYIDSIDRKVIQPPSVQIKFSLSTSEYLSQGKKPLVR